MLITDMLNATRKHEQEDEKEEVMILKAVGMGADYCNYIVDIQVDECIAESLSVFGRTAFYYCSQGGGIYYFLRVDSYESRIVFPDSLDEFVEEMCINHASVIDQKRVQSLLVKSNKEMKRAS
jgi:hypothetical protein